MADYAHTETDWKNEFVRIYGKSLAELENDFLSYVEALNFDSKSREKAQQRLKSLL